METDTNLHFLLHIFSILEQISIYLDWMAHWAKFLPKHVDDH